jgi:DUF971 family protein
MEDLGEAPAPVSISVDRTVGVTFEWEDEPPLRFDLEELRVNCPCATCRGLREQGRVAWPGPSSPQPLAIENAELVGAWGISFRWNDGHTTGIYAWSLLRAWRS